MVEIKVWLGDLEIDLLIGKDHKRALLTVNDRFKGLLKMADIRK